MGSFLGRFHGPDTDLVPDFSPGSLTGLGNVLPYIFLSAEREAVNEFDTVFTVVNAHVHRLGLPQLAADWYISTGMERSCDFEHYSWHYGVYILNTKACRALFQIKFKKK